MSTRARFSSLLFYGFGNLPSSIKGNLLGAPIFFYYNNVLGLDAKLVSLALALALVIDAFTDPLVGYLSDYTRTRWGRRHPYIYASILPASISYWLLLVANVGESQTALFWQLLVLIASLRFAWTLYQVPREAMGAEISKDYAQRNQMHGINSFFGWIGGAGAAFVTQQYFLGDSYSNAEGYHTLAVWGAIAILFTSTISAVGTHREIPRMEPPKARPKGLRAIYREIVSTLNHRSWLMLFGAGVVFSIFIGLTTGLGFYFNSFFWEWQPKDVAIFAIADLAFALILSALAGPLTKRFDKKWLSVRLFVLSIVIGPLLLVLRLSDIHYGTSLLPPNGDQFGPLWWVMLAHSVVHASVGILAWILVGSMTSDVVEDSQRQTGKRSEGLFFAGPHLIQKSISGLGLVIKGFILALVGFAPAAAHADKVLAIQDLAVVIVVLSFILPSISLYLLSRYEITRETHHGNLASLGYTDGDEDTASPDDNPAATGKATGKDGELRPQLQ